MLLLQRRFPVERLFSRTLPQILSFGLDIVMLRRRNGVRTGTLDTLSSSERGGPRYWVDAGRSKPWPGLVIDFPLFLKAAVRIFWSNDA